MVGFAHQTVLLREAVAALAPRDGGLYVDCTVGGGGHAGALLEAADCRVIGFDRDPEAVDHARAVLRPYAPRSAVFQARFSQMREFLDMLEITSVDGVLADLGVSSHQLDVAERGFSFRFSGPLDMRMDPSDPVSAADVVNFWQESDLADLIFELGEEKQSRRIAARIVAGRPWDDTAKLAAAIAEVAGRGAKIHPATRTFQALRMFVNGELGELDALLEQALDVLAPGGRLAIISFHSLEDRRVKQFFARESGKTAERDPYGNKLGTFRISEVLPPVVPAEDDPNPRARSARMRVAVRSP